MHAFHVRIGPVSYRIGSPWSAPVAALRRLYAGYPLPEEGMATVTARIGPPRPWRRWLHPQVAIEGDHVLPDTVPMALRHGLLAIEMAMNMQVALGERRFLLVHAAAVERGGKALILPGDSGSGKSTLAALLGEAGWRLMADEFVLIDLATGLAFPFPRAISLKNSAIAEMEARIADPARFGPRLSGTPKGELRHLRPREDAVARMDEPAEPALILFPSYGYEPASDGVSKSELFARITEGSTNYIPLGQPAFDRLVTIAETVPAARFAYPDSASGVAIVEQFCAEAGI
ncbi:HprK-related kinase A [Rhizorhabdus dicambivorans]|uniref:HprK-related kinase A n=1 Tax=Rhizorhabdus dicambivorans TaxID=1850238 RepID=A0A2A4G1Z8_9SPHN|nr:HprK-related kinase A [Rhizorhabdus dicambivorans]ATE66707.1 HprK-related kinase A [Rhizorhabdus dicambivorans]PCE43807.1 HprK-related kinase A [Rhizorhabdus dicambivorans]